MLSSEGCLPEYGVRGKRGDFEPLTSENLFYRVQVLSGRVPSTTPQQRAPDFTLRAFMRCEPAVEVSRQLVEGPQHLSTEVSFREGAAGAGFQVAFEIDSSLLVRKFDDDVKLPRAVARGVGAAAGVVVGEAREDVGRTADVVACRGSGTLQNVDESLVFGHPLSKATSAPHAGTQNTPETTNTHHTECRLCDLSGGEGLKNPRRS